MIVCCLDELIYGTAEGIYIVISRWTSDRKLDDREFPATRRTGISPPTGWCFPSSYWAENRSGG